MVRRLTSNGWADRQTQQEAVRVLRSNLMIAMLSLERRIVIVTSAAGGEGKTATTTRLARSLAEAGQRVILVDLDLRHPDAHRWINASNEHGVSDILRGDQRLADVIQYSRVSEESEAGLYFLPAGRIVGNPTELLGTERLNQLLGQLSEQSDIVLIDTPPVLPVADTLVIGRLATGAVLVTASRSTTTTAAVKAKDTLIRNQVRLLGVVVNKLQGRDVLYGYGYGEAPENGIRGAGAS